MKPGVLEFNDQSLLIQAEGGALHSEPGFARVTPAGIETGQPARNTAWLEPQHNYNQYWSQLNQTPLVAKEKWARHHADLAFAQLQSLWRQAGSPGSMVMLVPGGLKDAQLSLLLGLVKALPANTLAVLDSALAACLDCAQETLLVDLHLHQAVLSLVSPGRHEVRISAQEIIPDLGMTHVLNSVARHVSELLIDSARYDPLHTSAGEQAIFDQLPGWLKRLQWESEVSATVETGQGDLPFILRKDEVTGLLTARLLNVHSVVSRYPGVRIALSHESSLLSGLSGMFSSAELVPQGAGISNCFARLPQILEQVDAIYRVQSLRREEPNAVHTEAEHRLATHLLYQDLAVPLHRPVSIRMNGSGLELAAAMDPQAALTVVIRNRRLETLHSDGTLAITLPAQCAPGELITLEGHELRLIEVQGG